MSRFKSLLYALRPMHWIKNGLLFLPLVFAKEMTSWESVKASLYAFVCFCLVASSVYLLNDVVDAEQDQKHRTKKLRPIASGKVKPWFAVLCSLILFTGSIAFGLFCLGQMFALVIAGYFVLNLGYMFYLQKLVIIDVMCLAAFYILRVLGGTLALDVRISEWMIICVALLALFIGFNKRRHELHLLGDAAASHRPVLAKYNEYFIDQMIGIVTAATVVCYTIFTVDSETVERFGTARLMMTIPFVYYGIFRYLYLVHQWKMGGDPVRVFFSDKLFVLNIALWISISAGVIYLKF